MVARILTDVNFCFSLRSFLLFLRAKAMQNNFRIFEELVFVDLWIADCGFCFLVSGFQLLTPDFHVLGLPCGKCYYAKHYESRRSQRGHSILHPVSKLGQGITHL